MGNRMDYVSEVPIVFASDKNLIEQVFVAICSILEHQSSKYKTEFFIMVPDKETEEIGSAYGIKLANMYQDISISFIRIDDRLFQNVRDTMNYITKPAMYRLLIPDYLKQYDKCLYLDSDIYVYGDIIELFSQDVEGYYIAGGLALLRENSIKRIKKRLNMNENIPYINSGVLLMNLKKLREDEMVQTFMETIDSDISQSFVMQDQDLLNVCCQNNIKVLPIQFNTPLLSDTEAREAMLFLYHDRLEDEWNMYQNPFILHYAGEWMKPWKNPYLKSAKEWWQTASLILSDDQRVHMQKKAEKDIEEMFFSRLLLKVKDVKEIVIFGYSELSRRILDSFQRNDIYSVRAFCDNDSVKQGEFYKEIKCISVSQAAKLWNNAVYVLSVQTRRKEIEIQLSELGICQDQIVQYVKKPEFLEEIVTNEFRERLLQDRILEEER